MRNNLIRKTSGTVFPSKQRQSGFTLLEILITLTIVMMLASFALPSYQRYVIRAEATAIVFSFESFKLAHDELVQEHGTDQSGYANVFFDSSSNGDAQYCVRDPRPEITCLSPNVTFYPAANLIVPGTDLVLGEGHCYSHCTNFKIFIVNKATSDEGIIRANRLLYEFAQIMEPNVTRISYARCMSTTAICVVGVNY